MTSESSVDCIKGKNERFRPRFKGKRFKYGKKGHHAIDCRSAKSASSGAADVDKKGAAAVGASSTGVGRTLCTCTVGCTGALNTRPTAVRSAELKWGRCWPN